MSLKAIHPEKLVLFAWFGLLLKLDNHIVKKNNPCIIFWLTRKPNPVTVIQCHKLDLLLHIFCIYTKAIVSWKIGILFKARDLQEKYNVLHLYFFLIMEVIKLQISLKEKLRALSLAPANIRFFFNSIVKYENIPILKCSLFSFICL